MAESTTPKCTCEGCRTTGGQSPSPLSDAYGISIDRNLNVHEGHDHTVDNRQMRLGLLENCHPPEKWFTQYPDEYVCPESRRTIALEAIRRWAIYLAEAEQEIEAGGPPWKKQ